MVTILTDIGNLLFVMQHRCVQNQYMMIPSNFKHKKSALFFSLFEELKGILEYYFLREMKKNY